MTKGNKQSKNIERSLCMMKHKKRLLSGVLACVMTLSTMMDAGVPLTVEAKEADVKKEVTASISIDGLTDGDVSVLFSEKDYQWETAYQLKDGISTVDGKETKETSISFPKEKDVRVTVIADDYKTLESISVQNKDGLDVVTPVVDTSARSCTFSLPDKLPKELFLSIGVKASETKTEHGLIDSKVTGTSKIRSAIEADYAKNQQKTRFRRATRGLDYMPEVGKVVTGRTTIAFHGANINRPGTFSGTFESGDFAGESYLGFLCTKHGAANPGVPVQPLSQTGDYTATCTATGDGWAEFKVDIVSDAASMNYQTIGGQFRITARNPEGNFYLKKVPAKPEYANGNTAYDLTGAKYGVYTDLACTNLVDTLTVQSNDGWTNQSQSLTEGTYYVKELPGTAKGYLLNPHIRSITVDAGVTNKKIILDGDMVEPMANDPIPVVVQKSFEDWDEAGKLQGDITTLAGIKFRFDYYANVFTSVDDAKKNGRVNASAVFETTDVGGNGLLLFETAKPVNGTVWPYKEGSFNTCPLGTVLITEVSALDGMVVKGMAQAFTLTDNNRDGVAEINVLEGWPNQGTASGPIGSYENEIWRGGVTVYKADGDEHKQNPQGDGALNGVRYDIINKSANPVSVKGKEIPVDGVAMTIEVISDKQGTFATTGPEVLPYGTYQIQEKSGNDSYNKATWVKDFTIRTKGQMVTYGTPKDGWNEDMVKRGGIEITKADADTGNSIPQGDATLANTSYDIYNRSQNKVYVNGAWYKKDAKVMTVETQWDDAKQRYIAKTGEKVLPYGTYEIIETGAPVGYHKNEYRETVQIRSEGQIVELKDAASKYNVDEVFRGGVSVTKVDKDWHSSKPQGDATLEDTVYQIVNRSKQAVFMREDMKLYQPGEVVMTLKTKWNDEKQAYVASTKKHSLPYGTYDLVEVQASNGYNTAEWTKQFTIRQDGEMHYFDRAEDKTVTGPDKYEFHHQWNENPVKRGGIIVGKVDRETGQYTSLGEAHLDGAVFDVINRSKEPVYVNGKTYKVGDSIMQITTKEMEWKGRQIVAATTGNNILPYGTYEVKELSSGTGYLYDSASKAWSKTVEIREQDQMIDLTAEENAVANQVLREDWHFQKKQEDTMERMDKIPFVVTSMTTGERHVLVTDENGTWGSAWVKHSEKTNENDPTSPITNGALGVDEDGRWYVKDSSKLNFDSGMWFTGLPEDEVTWNEDGKSYQVGDKTVTVKDDKRAFPYDTYKVQELRCENNKGYKLVNFTVTLHRYTADHDGPGLDIDYGTIDDKRIAIGTTLTYGAFDKVAPANEELVLRDTVTFDNLDVDADYVMKGELHLKNEDGRDGGKLAEAEKVFNSGDGTGKMTMEFTLDASDLAGKEIVAYEYLLQDGQVIAEHADMDDAEQTVKFPEIKTTLTGDLGHMSNAGNAEIKLTDKISYKNLEVGKEYTATGTLMDKTTGEAIVDSEGNPITAAQTFVPVSEEGSVKVTFVFSGVDVAGKTLVAFETVSKDDVEYATHTDIEDEGQTVYFPVVDTFAADGVDGNKDLAADKDQTIVDAFHMENVLDGYEYKLVGELHIRNADGTDGGVLMQGDKPVTAEWTSTSKESYMTFTDVDTTKLGGKDLVVFQTLYGRKAEEKAKEDAKWVKLAEHVDIQDEDQSVRVPKISTRLLSDMDIHEMQVPADGMVTITDTISYENVTPGHSYTVQGTLHIRGEKDGKPVDGGVVTQEDKDVLGTAEFTAKEENGTVDVTFTFDARGLEGKSIVAFESLYSDVQMEIPDEWKDSFGKFETSEVTKVATHEEISDEGQTIHFADIKTTLTSVDDTHETQVPTGEDKTVTLTDTVAYKNLIPGRTYNMTGTLHVQDIDKDGHIVDGGTIKDANGNDLTATTTFTPVKPNGSVDVVFTFDASALDGKTVVAFESVSTEDKTFAVHSDITDEAQAVHFVKVSTLALTEQGLHETYVPVGKDKTVTITDTFTYENVIPGTEYEVTGTVHLASKDANGVITDGGELKDKEGKPVTGTAKFTAEKSNGSVDITFTFDAEALSGQTVVLFETLSRDGVVIAQHKDIMDAAQSIHFVEIGTQALADNSLSETQVPTGENKTVTITDTVSYRNVIPGTEYEVIGTLRLQNVGEDGTITDGGSLKDKDGKDVLARTTFTPETENGTVDVTFTFDATGLEGKTVTAFEQLRKEDVIVAVHEDIEDEAQSIHFVTLKTTALAENGQHMTQVVDGKQMIVTDTVAYENLIPGETYTVRGTLHLQEKDENGTIVDGGVVQVPNPDMTEEDVKVAAAMPEGEEAEQPKKDLVGETTFTAEKVNGTVDVVFTFDASEISGKTVVAFETLLKDDKVIATHEDITDKAQSVNFVKVRTKALAENGKHEMQVPKDDKPVKIKDLVEYKNLIPGLEYTVTGTLHIQGKDESGDLVDKGTVKDKDGNDLTVTETFTAKEADGSVEVVFEVDAKALSGQTVVAFERISYEDAEIAVHTDITDEHQSVTFTPNPDVPSEPKPDTPSEIVKTGQAPFYGLMALLGVALAAGAGYVYTRKRRR